MMTIGLRLYTDPACEWSWAMEPSLRRLLWEFGDDPRLWLENPISSTYPVW
jgi:predicted DsbA family dithiol-disulfide isomerase